MKCMKLTYKSPLNGSVYCEGLVDEDDNRVDFGPYGVLQLYNRDDRLMRMLSDNCEDLRDCIPEELEGLVVKAVFGIDFVGDSGMYLLTEVYVSRQPAEREYVDIHQWVVGQLSDGWGEGLEQEAFNFEDVRFSRTVFDEDLCEFTEEEICYTARYYVHPWQHGPGWHLDLISEELVELDVGELEEPTELERALKDINDNLALILIKLNQIT